MVPVVAVGEAIAWETFPETRGKFLINAIEGAIGKDGDHIAGIELRRDGIDDRVAVGVEFGLCALRA
jgi:hypothetical protein